MSLPAHRHSADCDCYRQDLAAVQQQAQPQIVHIHQAPPDRTLQRVALGSGMGAGAVAAGVYYGPLLVAAMASMAATLAILALLVAVIAWAIVSIVHAVGGSSGKARAGRKGRRG